VVASNDSITSGCIAHIGVDDLLFAGYSEGYKVYTYRVTISVPADFRRHLVGKTLINVFHSDIAEMRFVGKLVIMQTFS